MLGLLAAYTWARRRNRKLDEQAERQRRRAPEPLPEEEIQREIADDQTWVSTDTDVRIVAAVPIAVLIVLGLTVGAWVFWIGLLVLFALIGLVSSRA
jgi:hypothetical protein